MNEAQFEREIAKAEAAMSRDEMFPGTMDALNKLVAGPTGQVQLVTLTVGTSFTFRGEEYVLIDFARTRATIKRISDDRQFKLSMSAFVKPGEARPDVVLATQIASAPTLRAGDRVRIVADARTRRKGIAGLEGTIVRVNQSRYSLDNGWRVPFAMVEKV